VWLPVANTTAVACPDVHEVPEKTTVGSVDEPVRDIRQSRRPDDRHRLTGERGHVELELAVQQSGIRADPVALADVQDVAAHDLGDRHRADDAVPGHPRGRGQVAREGLDRPSCLPLLRERDECVHADHADYRPPQGRVAGHEGQPGGQPQQQGERMRELGTQFDEPSRAAADR
jgi:hypothetical protein